MWAEIWKIRMRVPSSKCAAIAIPGAIVSFNVMFIILTQKQYVIICDPDHMFFIRVGILPTFYVDIIYVRQHFYLQGSENNVMSPL